MKNEQKVYIKGDSKRGAEIIKLLEDLGGRTSYSFYDGTNENVYYFIGPDGEISSVSKEENTLYSFIKEFYKEIKLEKWKPEYGECYYYFTDMQGIMVGKWKNNPSDSWRYDFGNCFKSYEEAKEAINKIKEILNNK